VLSRATFMAAAAAALLTACGGGADTSSNPDDHALIWLDEADPADLHAAASRFRCTYEVSPHGVYLYTDNPSATAALITATNELRAHLLYVRSLGCR
jgi:hypothetical protein